MSGFYSFIKRFVTAWLQNTDDFFRTKEDRADIYSIPYGSKSINKRSEVGFVAIHKAPGDNSD